MPGPAVSPQTKDGIRRDAWLSLVALLQFSSSPFNSHRLPSILIVSLQFSSSPFNSRGLASIPMVLSSLIVFLQAPPHTALGKIMALGRTPRRRPLPVRSGNSCSIAYRVTGDGFTWAEFEEIISASEVAHWTLPRYQGYQQPS
jgi:hypothetical protein